MYKYFQPNEKDIKDEYGDCVIRAFCKLTGKSWKDVFDMFLPMSYKYQRMPNSIMNVREMIETLGFTPMKVNVRDGSNRPTVKELSRKFKNSKVLVQVSNHVVACDSGNYYDTWDSGYKPAYKYWIKENTNIKN